MGVISSVLRRLLPTGRAWRLLPGKKLDQVIEGLSGIGESAREYGGESYFDFFPAKTRELEEWEAFYGLSPTSDDDESDRRAALAAEWKATGGQSKAYIEGVLRTAGYDVWLHEWWSSPSPYVARDPRDYADPLFLGTVQCGEPLALCGEPDALCNAFTAVVPNYWANLSLNPTSPPGLPSDPARWPYFIYVGGETFPDPASVAATRLPGLRRLIQKLKPSQNWVLILITSVDSFVALEDGDEMVTETGALVLIE